MIQNHCFETEVERCFCPNCGCNLRQFDTFIFGNITIDKCGRFLFEGQELQLPKSQHLIAEALVKAKGRALTRSFLATFIGSEIYDQTVSVYILRLRSNFRRIDPKFNQISALRGFGAYRWEFRCSAAMNTDR